MSPAYPRSMHICFYLQDDVDFDQFIADLEAEVKRLLLVAADRRS